MTTNLATLTKRLDALELRNQPAARMFVCDCARRNGRVNLPSGEHLPDCPAAGAGDTDLVLVMTYETDVANG